jgi:rRNA maturation RNase YbeY
MDSIHFFYEDTTFTLEQPDITSHWVQSIITEHEQEVEALNFIFCSDDYLLEINRSYLDHDYYTDIITFDNREINNDPLESDIFISIDRVKDNAQDLKITFHRELHRVMIHGVLHLIGWNDKTDEQKQAMREKEEACLSLHPNYQ